MRILNLGGFKCFQQDICIKYKTSVFPNGSIFFRLEDPGHVIPINPYSVGAQVKIYTRLNNSEEIFRLIMAVDALRRENIERIECYIPDIPYSQQDRVCSLGESLSLKVFANIINDLKFSKVHTWDAHSNACSLLIDNLVDYTNKNYIQTVLSCLRDKTGSEHFNFISPDAGASKKILNTLSSNGTLEHSEIFQCEKVRDPITNLLTKVVCPKINNDLPCLIIDDLCLMGGTFKNIAIALKESGCYNDLYLAVTHGVLPDGAVENLRPYFKGIYISNSRDDDYAVGGKKYTEFVHQLPLF